MWELYKATATQYCHDLHVSPLMVMELYKIPPLLRPRLLRQLSLIYDLATENQKGVKGDA